VALHLPEGKRIAVAISPDFDAHSAWMSSGHTSPSYLSRGEFGAEVGVPRLLDLFNRYDIKTTFCTPGHSMVTFPRQIEQIMAAGHEIASHGCYHERIPDLEPDRERELMTRQIEQYAAVVGGRPRGYRSPAWDFSDVTMQLLEEFGYEWDSSLMGREFEPYRPRPVTVNWEEASTFGMESSVLELPVSWYLDDWPPMEFTAGISAGLGDHDLLNRRWKGIFDYARQHYEAGVYILTVHPQCSGRAHLIGVLENLIQHIGSHPDVWFATLSEVFDCWKDDAGTGSNRGIPTVAVLGQPPRS